MRKVSLFIRLFIVFGFVYAIWKVAGYSPESLRIQSQKLSDQPPQLSQQHQSPQQQTQQALPAETRQTQTHSTIPLSLTLSSFSPTVTTTIDGKPSKPPEATFNISARIPRILHQAFASEMVYENYKPFINGCMTLNPDWTYYLWRDSDAEALISSAYPEFLGKYKQYRDVLERADSIRYVVLHHFGGIYLDMDVECVKPFFPALADMNSFLDQERIEQTNIFWGWPFSVMNSAMGSAPGHPFFRQVIDEMLREKHIGNAFATTGPAILTRVYTRYVAAKPGVPVQLLKPKIMSPLMDTGKNWRAMCGSLPASAKSKPESQRSWKERGCVMLESKNWRNDDTDNSTICIHRFLHLGYSFAAGARKQLFNMTVHYWPRVRTYKRGDRP